MQQWVDLDEIDLRLAVTDSPVGEQPEMVKCPQHDDATQSLAVYFDHLHCYGCRIHLTRRLESLALLLDCTVSEAGRVAGKYTGASLDAYRQRVTKQATVDPLPRGLAIAYVTLLHTARANRKEWFSARGIDLEKAAEFYLGHDGTRFVIPIFDKDDRLLTLRFRRDDVYETSYFDARRGKEVAIPKYSGMRGRNGLYLFPEWHIDLEEPEYLVVVEGELDAVRLWQEGIPAVSTTNGAGQVHRTPALLRDRFPSVTSLFIATDKDEPGIEASKQTVVEGRRLGFRVTEVGWDPAWGKDVTELYLHGHTLEEGYFVGDDITLPDHHQVNADGGRE